MPSFIASLGREPELLQRIADHATQTPCPDFGDLWWGQIDLDAVLSNPGVKWETPSRMFVVAQISGELRYFAGGKNIYESDYDYELGVMGSLRHALAFAEAYLVQGKDLRDICFSREVRRARMEAKPETGILRPIVDHRQ